MDFRGLPHGEYKSHMQNNPCIELFAYLNFSQNPKKYSATLSSRDAPEIIDIIKRDDQPAIKKEGEFCGNFTIDELSIMLNLIPANRMIWVCLFIPDSKHAVGFMKKDSRSWHFFDPNFGEHKCCSLPPLCRLLLNIICEYFGNHSSYISASFDIYIPENIVNRSDTYMPAIWQKINKIYPPLTSTLPQTRPLIINDYSPLQMAASSKQKQSNLHFLEISSHDPNEPCEYNDISLHLASSAGSAAIVESLLTHGAKVNHTDNNNCTPLLLATEHNHEEVVKSLLYHGANPNIPDNNGNTPIHFAAKNNNRNMINLLFAYKANPLVFNTKMESPLFWAFKYDLMVATKSLLLHMDTLSPYDINSDILHIAICFNNVEIIELMLKKNANPHLKNRYGYTPLHYAIKQNHPEIVSLLLKSGANANALDGMRMHPLQLTSNSHIIYLLQKHGADPKLASLRRSGSLFQPYCHQKSSVVGGL